MKTKKLKRVSRLLKNLSKTQQKGIAWLVDPEKDSDFDQFDRVKDSGLDLILVGGSSPSSSNFEKTIQLLQKVSGDIPICIFPGSYLQLSDQADAILFMSLISGRNPEYLISHQVQAAAKVKQSGLEVLPTGYILVNNGELLSVHSVSQTMPLSNEDAEFVKATALAGKFLGMRYFYLDAGSGASIPVSATIISAVKEAVKSPVIVGGGLSNSEKVKSAFMAGADLVVLGNSIEKDPGFLYEVLDLKRWYNHSLTVN
ncbi:putative glycerol-1-phosphate prenyltransferase [Algoriphagus alkaliphilus]|uniref:Geranylgeranylglyceryl phosphate synthase n=1 Tax=Algoriphagus alkaliphilus TaxID=279824 RepID=A0A1G5YEK1_9BACT|nr:phosphoglycerol geranylgeranyltransferase [Algoriphagus alkaliphilus]SDA80772.1 putative glycerol-1-phosphate prenyltransferase [Algoriphagus alkaliphilus]